MIKAFFYIFRHMSFLGTCGLRVMYIETGGMSCRLSVLHRYFPQRAPTYFTASLTVIPAQAGIQNAAF